MNKKLKTFLLNLLLFFTSIILLINFSFVGIVTAIFSILFKRKSTDYFLDFAYVVDVLGNVMCQHFFNAILITKSSKHLFGKKNSTISKCLAHNLQSNTVTKIGSIVVKIIDTIDKDHFIKSL